jgi:hypothetical protein
MVLSSLTLNMTRTEAAAAFQLREQRRLSRRRRAVLKSRGSTAAAEDGHSHVAQLPANVSDCTQHGVASLQERKICDRNHAALIRNANSFTDCLPCLLDSAQQQYPSGSHHIGFLSCTLFNVRSLNNKLFDIHYLLCTDKPDILCITATWPQPIFPITLLFSVFRADRPSGRIGGGVCILTSNATVKAIQLYLFLSFSLHLELRVIDITFDKVKLRLFVCYRPPSNNTDVLALQYAKDMCECIEMLIPRGLPVLICGDFNLP